MGPRYQRRAYEVTEGGLGGEEVSGEGGLDRRDIQGNERGQDHG
jgi:hypothetical protein